MNLNSIKLFMIFYLFHFNFGLSKEVKFILNFHISFIASSKEH